MSDYAPFLVDAASASEVRELLARLNARAFLTRSVQVNLDDYVQDDQGTYGMVVADSLSSATPQYIANCKSSIALANMVVTGSRLYAVPFVHMPGYRMATFSANVATAIGGSTLRLAIYDSYENARGNIYPNSLLWESAAISSASTGSKSDTPYLDLQERRVYWAALNCSTGIGVNSVPLSGVDSILATSAASKVAQTHIYVSSTYGAMPATFPASATVATTQGPALFYTYTASAGGRTTRTVPVLTPPDAGFAVRSVRIARGSSLLATAQDQPYVVLRAKTVGTNGSHTLGTYDSRYQRILAGQPFSMTGGDIDYPLAKGAAVAVEVEQNGWPKVSMRDTSAFVDYLYVGAQT